MERFIIEGGRRLCGTIVPAGNKIAALPLLAAMLLTNQPVLLQNVPQIGDVATKMALLNKLGVATEQRGEHSWLFSAANVGAIEPDATLARKIRTSILLAGPLLARRGYVTLPRPGGDMIGRRRLDTHFLALRGLGASIELTPTEYILRADRLRGADLFLDEMSVTATEQAILGAVLAQGDTTIGNAASEPHIQDLCRCLNALGALIEGIGTNMLSISGVSSLHGGEFTIGPDFMEVASFIGLAAVTGSAIRIAGGRPRDHRMTRIAFGKLGVRWDDDGDDLVVPGEQELRVQEDAHNAIPKIDSAPWPGFNPDLISIALVVATQARGTVLIHEKMFESRLFFVDKLVSMGARIILCDPHRVVVTGPAPLVGQRLESPDIRAGMAMVIAALCAEGRSTLGNIRQIDHGYARMGERPP